MSTKTRSTLKIVSVLLFAMWILMVQSIIIVPALQPYLFWIVVLSFVLLFIAAR
ncbi:hypothetical protein [Fulvivirga ligni]|uniref:hypothetical protein n=1 Tax=Fulvivirga ligni TaxID=2904246 RepID=UPI001F36E85B|nr:hypothetical protein [Fulvivirga ligni]UII20235.1 hypothetical protein LVD16_20540 [Fulvivirga ligni]